MIKFELPDGVMVPQGKTMGDTFQAMATFKLMAGGDVELCQVDGEDLPGYKDDGGTANPEAADDASQPAQQGIQSMLLGSMGGGAPPS